MWVGGVDQRKWDEGLIINIELEDGNRGREREEIERKGWGGE